MSQGWPVVQFAIEFSFPPKRASAWPLLSTFLPAFQSSNLQSESPILLLEALQAFARLLFTLPTFSSKSIPRASPHPHVQSTVLTLPLSTNVLPFVSQPFVIFKSLREATQERGKFTLPYSFAGSQSKIRQSHQSDIHRGQNACRGRITWKQRKKLSRTH